MTWREGRFFDPENPGELREDPFRCSWCNKPFDAARMSDNMAPETKIVDAVLRMRAEGRELKEILHYVNLAWNREEH
jgi:hypothetical protein